MGGGKKNPSSASSSPLPPSGNIPKAMVTESNGEISCSVEETNRIRALLGMKPLNVQKPLTKAEKSAELSQQREEAAERSRRKAIADLERRVARAKRKRMLNAKLEGQGIGDELRKSVGELSAAEWIERNRRKTVEEERLLAEKTALKLAEQEAQQHSAADLRGVAVRHDAGSFEAGVDTVLTLADRSVLDDEEEDSPADVLQNENMADDERTKELLRIKNKSGMPVYVGTDDHEFEEGAVVGEKKILRQYDEEVDSLARVDEHKKKLKGAFVLDGSGIIAADAVSKPKVTFVGDRGKPQESLMQTVQATKIAEYYTQDELVSFKKKKRRKKKKDKTAGGAEAGGKKKRRKKKRPSSIADELEELAGAGDGGGGSDDLGSRKRSRRDEEEKARAAADRARKDRAFQAALASANADNREAFVGKSDSGAAAQSSAKGSAPPPPPPPPLQDEDEDDADLQRALARARALKRKAAMARVKQEGSDGQAIKTETGGFASGADLVAMAHANKAAAEAEEKQRLEKDGSTTMSFTSTSEFSRRLQTQLQEQTAERRAQELAELKAKTLSVLQEQKKLAAQQLERAKQAAAGSGAAESDSEDDVAESAGPATQEEDDARDASKAAKNAKQLTFMRNEHVHSGGIAATLAMMRQTGVTRAAVKSDVTYAGRTNDPKPTPTSQSDRVKLIYKDKFGRVMTPKEAFRQHSYKFHGKGPGQKRREKTLRKYREEQALKKNKGAGFDMVDRIKQHQQRTGQAYVTLPGHK
eukprot:INCI16506.1.p1 GENE.INCI16506.1~~INCI16506.1.p1  ORF type:complete len:758 (+),score=210.63 INCI16506.1:346-2619(+)